ncbi:transposase family protein [Streptomyces sp. NPDC093568]|uniref:transposase family protein n=1 Tax=Streptomyces sp. NPDC093568 TaxID=3366041 RepID=UPI0038024104
MPGLLERLAEIPDPRDPRGIRHALAVVLALGACSVLAGATSLLAVGEWIADAPRRRPPHPHLLRRPVINWITRDYAGALSTAGVLGAPQKR